MIASTLIVGKGARELQARFTAVILMSAIVGVIFAGIMAIFRKTFRASFNRGFCITALVWATVLMVVDLTEYRRRPGPRQVEAARRAIDGIEEDIEQLAVAATRPGEVDLKFDSQKTATNDLERARLVIQGLYSDLAALQKDYLEALKADGISSLLNATRVAADQDFSESRRILAAASQTMGMYRARFQNVIESMPDRMAQGKFDPEFQAEFMQGFQRGMRQSSSSETWKMEARILEHMTDMIDHLEATRQAWHAEGEQFIFDNDADLQRFNEILSAIQEAAQRQAQLREQQLGKAKEQLREARDGLTPK